MTAVRFQFDTAHPDVFGYSPNGQNTDSPLKFFVGSYARPCVLAEVNYLKMNITACNEMSLFPPERAKNKLL